MRLLFLLMLLAGCAAQPVAEPVVKKDIESQRLHKTFSDFFAPRD